ncbi:MAG: hypothetical protein AB7F98_12505, partial [Novosphingobium sp.]
MKTRTIILIVAACIAGFLAFVGGIVGVVFYATSDLTDAGDRFFEMAHKGDYNAAYGLMAEDVKRTRSKESLEAYARESGFDKVV